MKIPKRVLSNRWLKLGALGLMGAALAIGMETTPHAATARPITIRLKGLSSILSKNTSSTVYGTLYPFDGPSYQGAFNIKEETFTTKPKGLQSSSPLSWAAYQIQFNSNIPIYQQHEVLNSPKNLRILNHDALRGEHNSSGTPSPTTKSGFALGAIDPVNNPLVSNATSQGCITTTSDPQDCGNLSISPSVSHKGMWKATWNDSSLKANTQVFLVGVQGNHADSTTNPIETLASGVSIPGTAVVYFTPPLKGWSSTSQEAFEMHTVEDTESLPVAQMPEVPWAAGLPIMGIVPLAYVALRHQHRSA